MAKDVLIGVVRSSEQLEANLSRKFYHIPAGNVSDDKLPIRYVALYLSENSFKTQGGGVCYIGEVCGTEKLPRGEITELPARFPETLYYKFIVKKWTKLPAPVKLHSKIMICEFCELAELITKL